MTFAPWKTISSYHCIGSQKIPVQPALAFLQTGAALPNELVNAVDHDWIRVAFDHCERFVGERQVTSVAKSCVVVMISNERQLYAPLSLQLLSFAHDEEFSQFISQ